MLQYSIYGVDGILEGAQQSTGVGYLVNWYGPYPTDLDRYDELGKVSTHINIGNESIHVQDVVFFPARQNATDNYIFKKALMDYGAFLVAIYSGENSKYYNETSAARYYNGTKGINHAVTLVGWDDNYPASNFLNPPSGDGAWIIKTAGVQTGEMKAISTCHIMIPHSILKTLSSIHTMRLTYLTTLFHTIRIIKQMQDS